MGQAAYTGLCVETHDLAVLVYWSLAEPSRGEGEILQPDLFVFAAPRSPTSRCPAHSKRPPFPRARPTKDVDGVVATTSYSDIEALDQALRAREFRTPPATTMVEDERGRRQTHVHKWLAPGGIEFDLVPSGAHLGGSGSTWDRYALELSETVEIRTGQSIWHANAPSFLAMKWAAHDDRGKDDPVNSTDLEDILALIAFRPIITDELQQSPPELRRYVRDQTAGFLRNPDVGDLLATHLNNATAPRIVIDRVRATLGRIAHRS